MNIEEKLDDLCLEPFFVEDVDTSHSPPQKDNIQALSNVAGCSRSMNDSDPTDLDQNSSKASPNFSNCSKATDNTDHVDEDQNLSKKKSPAKRKGSQVNTKSKRSKKDSTKVKESPKKDKKDQNDPDKSSTSQKRNDNGGDDEEPSKKSGKSTNNETGKADQTTKNEDNGSDDEDVNDSSSDEDVNKLNKASKKLGDFRSIRDLPTHKFYMIKLFETVQTVNGPAIRIKLYDKATDEQFFTHLPRRLYDVIAEDLENLNEICLGDEPFYFAFLGFKGRGFKIKFTRDPKKTKKH